MQKIKCHVARSEYGKKKVFHAREAGIIIVCYTAKSRPTFSCLTFTNSGFWAKSSESGCPTDVVGLYLVKKSEPRELRKLEKLLDFCSSTSIPLMSSCEVFSDIIISISWIMSSWNRTFSRWSGPKNKYALTLIFEAPYDNYLMGTIDWGTVCPLWLATSPQIYRKGQRFLASFCWTKSNHKGFDCVFWTS